jgi:dUTP pyrophosphatase
MKQIKIVCKDPGLLPKYQTAGSAGMDLHASLDKPLVLKPMQREIVPTGIFVELPSGVEAQIRPRSGLAIKQGITVLNAPATIDSDYRGEYMVILINLSQENFEINNGDRIAQVVFSKYETVEWQQVDKLDETKRGHGGFGSTGQ